MPSKRQIEANRKNAQLSTGPKTPEGRAAVRLNGVTHGLTAQTLVLPGEHKAEFQALFDSLADEHQPATPTEEILVGQLAMATWRLRRLYQMEAGYFSTRLLDTKDHAERHYSNPSHSQRLGVLIDQSDDAWVKFSRYQGRLERSFYKALQELQRLRSLRQANVKNQTQSKASTQPPTPEPAPIRINHDAPAPLAVLIE